MEAGDRIPKFMSETLLKSLRHFSGISQVDFFVVRAMLAALEVIRGRVTDPETLNAVNVITCQLRFLPLCTPCWYTRLSLSYGDLQNGNELSLFMSPNRLEIFTLRRTYDSRNGTDHLSETLMEFDDGGGRDANVDLGSIIMDFEARSADRNATVTATATLAEQNAGDELVKADLWTQLWSLQECGIDEDDEYPDDEFEEEDEAEIPQVIAKLNEHLDKQATFITEMCISAAERGDSTSVRLAADGMDFCDRVSLGVNRITAELVAIARVKARLYGQGNLFDDKEERIVPDY
jgi:hypothetical protein